MTEQKLTGDEIRRLIQDDGDPDLIEMAHRLTDEQLERLAKYFE